MKTINREQLLADLEIDREDLDTCLIKQPELFYHVSEAYVVTVSERDEVKLRLEEAIAELDQQIRRKAAEDDERVTEATIQQRIKAAPRIQQLQREYLSARQAADSWQALKEAFQQRSYMLRELVALHISRLRERDSYSDGAPPRTIREALGDRNREELGKMRRARREASK